MPVITVAIGVSVSLSVSVHVSSSQMTESNSPNVTLIRWIHCTRRGTAELLRKLAGIRNRADYPELRQAVRVTEYAKMGRLRTTVTAPDLRHN